MASTFNILKAQFLDLEYGVEYKGRWNFHSRYVSRHCDETKRQLAISVSQT